MTKRVLIVDDSQGWREFNTSALNALNENYFEIDTAVSAKKAFELIMSEKDNPYDLILSDLYMEQDFSPELAGEWFVRQVTMLNEYRTSIIIIISSMYNIDYIANRLGVSYIRKSALAGGIISLKLLLESKGIKFTE